MAAPPTLGIPENQAGIAAGVKPDGTRSGIALDADGKIILSPTGGGVLPAGAATEAKQDTQITRLNALATAAAQTDASQRTGVLGVNGTSIASNANPVPISDAGGAITVDGTVAVSSLPALAVGANTIGAVTGPSAVALAKDSTLTDASQRVGVLGVNGTTIATTANPLPTDDIMSGYVDPCFQVSRTGYWRGKAGYVVNVMGRRSTFTANVLNDIVSFTPSAGSSTVINEMTGSETLEIVSANTADASAGTGARTVRITYIDALNTVGALNSTTVTMNGTTPVSLGAVRALAIQWAEVITTGTGNVAAGDITIRSTATPTNLYELISAGGNRSLSGRFMVPVGMTAYVGEWQGSAVNQDMDIRLRATVTMVPRTVVTPYLFQDAMFPASGAVAPSRHLSAMAFPAGTKIKFSALLTAVTGSPRCEASIGLTVIEN